MSGKDFDRPQYNQYKALTDKLRPGDLLYREYGESNEWSLSIMLTLRGKIQVFPDGQIDVHWKRSNYQNMTVK
jgi:hypothetical protein